MAVPNNAIQLAAIPRFIHPRCVRRRCDRRFVELRRFRRCVPPLIRQAVPARGNTYAHKLAVALTGWRRAPEKRPGARTRRGRQESALRHGVGREWDVVFSGVGLPHKSLSLFYHRKPTTAFSHSSKASVNSSTFSRTSSGSAPPVQNIPLHHHASFLHPSLLLYLLRTRRHR